MPLSGNTTRWLHHQYTLTISPLYSQAVPGTISYRYSASRELTLQQYSTPMSHCPPAHHACSLDPPINYQYCSVTIQTSNLDFIIASTAINDDSPCTIPTGYTGVQSGGNFEV